MSGDTINDLATLEQLYGKPGAPSVLKKSAISTRRTARLSRRRRLPPSRRSGRTAWMSRRAAIRPVLSTSKTKTLLLPDRRGNNRIDSLRNILHDNRVALLLLIPGIGETLRINGRAEIVVAPAVLQRFAHRNQLPRSVLRIRVEAVFFQCSRAILRSGLWEEGSRLERSALPSPGHILAAVSQTRFDGEEYDQALPQRLKDTLY